MKTPHWHSCNVLQGGADARQLWQFTAGNSQVSFQAEHRSTAGESLPFQSVAKDWRTLWQDKLNIAWLPADQVFLRVAHLPKCDPGELRSMLELQLEKLSPLPVNQIVWSFENLSGEADEQQTVVFIIAERNQVEQFLSGLEKDRYVADRLELPLLHHVVAQRPREDGTWIYLATEGTKILCLAAWWYDGLLQNLSLIQAPDNDQGPRLLADHLTRISWAGEIEGWLTRKPAWHLVADDARVATWGSALGECVGGDLQLHSAPSLKDLATLAAGRGIRNESKANLLPAEFATRYRQQFVDRLWMQGLAAVVAAYLLYVVGYAGWVKYYEYQRDSAQRAVDRLAGAYTNAQTLKERVRVLQEQAGLKYAALDCWKTASELLPPELTLDALNFQGGDRLFLAGTVSPQTNSPKVTEFIRELHKARIEGAPLFDEANLPAPSLQLRGDTVNWSFTANLKVNWKE